MDLSQGVPKTALELFQVPASHIDAAWRDGAHVLSQACKRAEREVTADQLKMLLARGERTLLGLGNGANTIAWAAVQVVQLPNLRVLHVYAIHASGATSAEAFALLKRYAVQHGCTVVRGCCDEPIARLWERKFRAQRVYVTMEFEVNA